MTKSPTYKHREKNKEKAEVKLSMVWPLLTLSRDEKEKEVKEKYSLGVLR